MRYFLLLMSLCFSVPSPASGPLMVMHQVLPGESWRSLAARFQLTERQLRLNFNRERFMTPLTTGDWIWVPDRPPLPPALTIQPPAPRPRMPVATHLPSQLPRLGPPDPARAPKTDRVLLTIATAARAAATDQLDQFVEQQGTTLADSTLSFGSRQLSELPWLNPEQWSWDYQLPLFDKEPLLNSRMALPVMEDWQGELGLDYRDERLTYQAGLHFEQPLTNEISGHLEPVMDYQAAWDHRRGGLLMFLNHRDWTLGAGQYRALSGWQQQGGRLERPASGRQWFGEGRLGFVPGLSVSGRYYQWQGRQLSLYGSGDKYQAALSRQWSLNYAPWRIFRLQSSLLSNSKQKFESRFRLGIDLPLGMAPGQWWQSLMEKPRYDRYRPLQHHKVMVLQHR
ncbi:inverse autotransporter beta domain-containing protein [uncultured Oceanisphaera sp.]|uniref:inverse autotransporter beta domain-containing protein n=1 Tax=uncultured Oceanisphaera sp. TaxID=353858 RepID=UPI0026387888|nr:inverse autotransporter beta domain-containing protein [uncultured Oceanisphaera sp.]